MEAIEILSSRKISMEILQHLRRDGRNQMNTCREFSYLIHDDSQFLFIIIILRTLKNEKEEDF
jgi:hypothetical protein